MRETPERSSEAAGGSDGSGVRGARWELWQSEHCTCRFGSGIAANFDGSPPSCVSCVPFAPMPCQYGFVSWSRMSGDFEPSWQLMQRSGSRADSIDGMTPVVSFTPCGSWQL